MKVLSFVKKSSPSAPSPSLHDLAAVFDDAPFGVLIVAPDGVMAYANDRQCDHSQMARESLIGRQYLSIFGPAMERAGLLSLYLRLAETGEPFERTMLGYERASDGAAIGFSVRGYRKGPWVILVTTLERTLEHQHARYMQLFENANDGIFMLSKDGRFVQANRKFSEITGIPLAAMIGRTTEIFLPGRRAQSQERLDRMMKEGRFGPYELEIATPNGKRTLSLNGFAVFEDGVPVGIINIARDVTKEHEQGEDLRRARDQALESARLKESFLANMSHEIRTPLNVILGCSSIVADLLAADASPDVSQMLSCVDSAGRRLQETIDSILDLSRIEAGGFKVRPEVHDLAEVARRQIEELAPLARSRGLALELHAPAALAAVRFDAYCLSQALANLISNAIKFTPAGTVRVEIDRSAGVLAVRVHDTGVGIDPLFLAALGQPFRQEDSGFTRRFEGSGLGLALVHRYLELNGAWLGVESEKGKGSTFTIFFSTEVGVSGGEHSAEAGRAGPQRSEQPRILVVEDDVETQIMMRTILKSRYDILVAGDGEEAVEALGSSPVALVLMDLSLRGEEDGLTLTRRIRRDERWRSVPIVALTAHVLPEMRDAAIAAGCDAFVAKPFGEKHLAEVLATHLGGAP